MKTEFINGAKAMLERAGFVTTDNVLFTRHQQGWFLNKSKEADFSVDFAFDNVTIESRTSGRRTIHNFAPCPWGWQSTEQQLGQLRNRLRNEGCNAIFTTI